MGAAPGWYDDPWRHAELRWWDGTSWTGWTRPNTVEPADSPVRPSAAGSPAATPTMSPVNLDRVAREAVDVLAGVDRITVVDVETTGLYRSDRIVEIAMITMDSRGEVAAVMDTLVCPGRDVGPSWIHGITASMVANAPTFEDIADHIADRLEGSVVVAHNLRFDTRMLQQEFDRLGFAVDWGIGLDTLRATGCALGVACAENGIPLTGAHRALNDARATAQLLLAVRDSFTTPCTPVSISPLRSAPAERVLTRDGFADIAVDVPYLAALARGVHSDHDVAPYVDLLDQALADLQLSSAERTELGAIADGLGFSAVDRQRAHREFLNGLIDAAVQDSIVTDSELDHLCRVAALLDLDEELVTRRTNPYRLTHDTIKLAAGLTVCFTGAALDDNGDLIDRPSVLDPEAISHGLLPNRSFTKSCGLLIVADAATQSSKMMSARRFGIPVASLADYRRALITGEPVPVTRVATIGTALVCGRCGSSWMAARRSTNPVCATCARSATPARVAVPAKTLRQLNAEMRQPKPGPSTDDTLICSQCGKPWPRPRTRGRPPKRCPACTHASAEVRA